MSQEGMSEADQQRGPQKGQFDLRELGDEGVKLKPVKKSGGRLTRRTLLKGLGAAAVLTVAGAGADQVINKGQVRKGIEKGIGGGVETAEKPITEPQDNATKAVALEKKTTVLSQPPTPVSTSVAKAIVASAPDDLNTQIGEVESANAVAKVQLTAETRLRNARATGTAVSEQIDAVRGTPTKTPVPPSTPTPNPDVVVVPRQAFNDFIDKGVEIALTAKADGVATNTLPPTSISGSLPGSTGNKGNEGGNIDWKIPAAVGVGAAAIGTAIGTRKSDSFRNFLERHIPKVIQKNTPEIVKRFFKGAPAPAAGPATPPPGGPAGTP